MPLDPETLTALQALVGQQYEIPDALWPRLQGDDLASLKADAAALRQALGMPPLQDDTTTTDQAQADSNGVDMTQLIRQAAGRT